MKVKEIKDSNGAHHSWAIKCPGCGYYHLFDSRWSFNGNLEMPTFSPSMKSWIEVGDPKRQIVCHSFVANGKIQFLSDCAHELRGQTIDLPEISEDWNS